MFTQCQDSPATGFSKSSTLPQTLKQVDQIVRLFFFFVWKFKFLYYKEILTEMFAPLIKKNKFSIDCSPSFKLNRIRFLSYR